MTLDILGLARPIHGKIGNKW